MHRFLAFSIAVSALAQLSDRPRFEVASIKLHPGIGNLVKIQPLPGGRLEVENFSVRHLLWVAYDIQDFQIVGAPDWTGSEHYDIQAKADAGASGKLMTGPMLQTLLEDRFGLKFHREKKQLPVYELTVAKGGAKIRPSKAGSCIPFTLDSSPPPPLATGEPQPTFCGFRGFGVDGINRKLEVFGVTMAEFVAALQRSELRRTIIDKTGLAGAFDIRMRWTLDDPSSPGPSIFTAIHEQLGLKLESTKNAIEVLVVDHVERPSAN